MPLLVDHIPDGYSYFVYFGSRSSQPARARAFIDLAVKRLVDNAEYVLSSKELRATQARARRYMNNSHRFCVAPMMDWTDRHCRYFLRLITPRARLYTEMVTTGAMMFGNVPRLLRFDPAEHPIALQLGGSDPRRSRTARGSAKPGATTRST